jgi:hypothetical protein
MMELIAEFHLEPLFKSHLAGMNAMGRRVPCRDPAMRRSKLSTVTKLSTVNSVQELTALLQHLGVRPDTPAMQCFALVDGATARAVETIGDWMNYLPEDCVRAMVSDGWHWST